MCYSSSPFVTSLGKNSEKWVPQVNSVYPSSVLDPQSLKSLFSGVWSDSAAQLNVACSWQIVSTQYLLWQQAPIQSSLLKQHVLFKLASGLKLKEGFLYQDYAAFLPGYILVTSYMHVGHLDMMLYYTFGSQREFQKLLSLMP